MIVHFDYLAESSATAGPVHCDPKLEMDFNPAIEFHF